MKIDFVMLDKLEAAGATAKVIIEMLRTQHEVVEAKRVTKRPKDAKRQRERRKATESDKRVTPSDTERQEATLSDTPRARLFREGKPALLTMNIADSRAGALIVQWLKLANDDEQLVLATILNAQKMAVADAPSYILATLKGKTDERRGQTRTAQASGSPPTRSDTVIAAMGGALSRSRAARAAGQTGDAGVREGRGAGPAGRDDAEPGTAGGDEGAHGQLALLPAANSR